MINGKRIAVVLPAYNAEKTLEATVRELPDLVDTRILVDDHSLDRTVEIAQRLGLHYFVHDRNYGYGRNQQTCYREALAAGADVSGPRSMTQSAVLMTSRLCSTTMTVLPRSTRRFNTSSSLCTS